MVQQQNLRLLNFSKALPAININISGGQGLMIFKFALYFSFSFSFPNLFVYYY
jgi:hypothetical protein